MIALALAFAGCAFPGIASGNCGSIPGTDPVSGMRVHVETLNDPNENVRICYRVGGGATHAIDLARSGTAPNVKVGFEGYADGGTLEAWRAGDDAIFHTSSASATETWYVIRTMSAGLDLQSYARQPAFD